MKRPGESRLRRAGRLPRSVALTASTFEETPTMVLSAGCDDYVRKPVMIAELLAKIEQHLGVQFLYQEDETAHIGFHVTSPRNLF